VFGITAACFFDAASAEIHMAGRARRTSKRKTGEAYIHAKDSDDKGNRMSVRCIRVGGRTTGAIGFEGLEDPNLTAGPLAALAAAHLERRHSFVHAKLGGATPKQRHIELQSSTR